MVSRCGTTRAAPGAERADVERRLARSAEALQDARARFHQLCVAYRRAEENLLAAGLEREIAALEVSRLADVVESLQRELQAE